ncbi:hypothetical protein D1614_17525 [Maribellus luteus]|uniref:Uncharacterized protein n=1 Tax=Maribellus luteus TaxID=2305463 RepID=A0A399STM8_9BACT|nr:hypothetical protein [Maribellus luteus]RIJ46728.1 hypothetical protein D1614_17525 [Maribellus luteus]
MKLFDKIIFASFIVNLIFIISILFLPAFAILSPEIFDKIFFSDDRAMFNLIAMPLNFIIVFFWGYCIWFLFKYDKYSKSIFPLFFFNMFYAPIYYYRVKIKKRPLRNTINKPESKTPSANLIEESDFEKMTRESIMGILELWSSKVEQIKYQESQADINVTEELFQQWNDLFIVDSKEIRETFSNQEFALLVQFDKQIHDNYEKLNQNFIELNDFVETDEWKELNLLATKIFKELNEK